MKICLNVLMVIIFAQFAKADCGTTSPIVGTFRLIVKAEPSVRCDTGRLKPVGCILQVYMTDSGTRQKIISVYGNPEVCDWKENETRELTVGRVCCDIGYRLSCEDGKDGMYHVEETDQRLACMTGTRLYVEKYKRKEKGKFIQRIYNKDKRAFEDAPKKSKK